MSAPQQHFSELISKFEEQQKQLLQQRKNTLKSLTNVRKSERYFRNEDGESPTKGQVHREKLKSEEHEKEALKVEEAEAEKPKVETHSPKKHEHEPHGKQLPKNIEQRFKRMMGDMTMHLKRAESKLKSEEEQAKKKAQLEKEAIQQQQVSVRALKDEKRQSLAKSKEDLIQKKDNLARKLLDLENTLLETRFKKYISQLDGFIHTKTLPKLLWRPAESSDVLTKLASESTEQLKVQQEAACKLVKSVAEPIQFSKVVVQNQTEYLTNSTGRYYNRLIGNILTESKPEILWRPVEWNSELRKLEAQSSEHLKNKLQQLKQSFEKPKTKAHQSSDEEISQSEAEHD